MKYRNIYVAATGQHVGKTTSTLGLVASFKQRGLGVGYCKPVGQKFLDIQNLRVDKDTLLFADLIHFELNPDLHSPIILGAGATATYLDHQTPELLRDRLLHASHALSASNEVVIYEGTGHPGVGSVADLSNADVAKLLDAGVVMIVEGGIGSTIDKMNMCLALFREKNVPILGVIVNKVLPDKMDKIRHYLQLKLDRMGLPLLGLMPYDRSLAFPLMKSVADAINGEVIYNNQQMDNKVEDIIAGSLIDMKELKSSNNLLLVVSTTTLEKAIKKIEFFSKMLKLNESPLAGIVATGDGDLHSKVKKYVLQHRIPLVRTQLDSYGSVLKISRIEVKINLQTPWKIQRAIELIQENVDLDKILNQIEQ